LLLLLSALFILSVFYIRNAPTQLAHYTDPVIYLAGAQSIAEGNGYRFATHVGTPKIGCHPPLQSSYLALFWRMRPKFPDNIALLYGAMVLLVLAGFTLFFWYAVTNGVRPIVAALLALAWGTSIPWCALVYSFMSDVLFILLATALVIFWSKKADANAWRTWLITGALVALMYLTRTAAMVVAGILAVAVLVRSFKLRQAGLALAYFATVVPAVVLWKLWGRGTPNYSDYIQFRLEAQGGLRGAIQEILSSTLSYLSGLDLNHGLFPGFMDLPSNPAIIKTVWSPILTAAVMLLCWGFIGLAAAGWWRSRTSARERVLGFIAVAYLAQLCVYPAHIGERAVYVLVPLVVVWACRGTALLPVRVVQSTVWRFGIVVFLALAAVTNVTSCARFMAYLNECSQPQELKQAGEWLRANSPPDAIVAATLSEPTAHFYNYSGRRVVENFFHQHPDFKFSVAKHSIQPVPHADYILLCWYSTLTVKDFAGYDVELAFASANRKYRLYRVKPASIGTVTSTSVSH
jgi:hypothetical protein